jgi:hypothetical protein
MIQRFSCFSANFQNFFPDQRFLQKVNSLKFFFKFLQSHFSMKQKKWWEKYEIIYHYNSRFFLSHLLSQNSHQHNLLFIEFCQYLFLTNNENLIYYRGAFTDKKLVLNLPNFLEKVMRFWNRSDESSWWAFVVIVKVPISSLSLISSIIFKMSLKFDPFYEEIYCFWKSIYVSHCSRSR